MLLKTFLFTLIFITESRYNENYVTTIKKLSVKHQTCLNSGIDMLNCSKSFYFEMDSMLNVVYNKCKLTLSENDRRSLLKEQRDWLKKRDVFIEKENKEFQKKIESNEWGPDMYMITYENDAEFVKKRILELIKRIVE